MAYFNYYPQGDSPDQTPRLELVAEEGEHIQQIMAGLLLDQMGVYGETMKRNYLTAAQSMAELNRLYNSPPSDIPVDLAVQLEDVPENIPIRDEATGQPVDEVQTKDGRVIKLGLEV